MQNSLPHSISFKFQTPDFSFLHIVAGIGIGIGIGIGCLGYHNNGLHRYLGIVECGNAGACF